MSNGYLDDRERVIIDLNTIITACKEVSKENSGQILDAEVVGNHCKIILERFLQMTKREPVQEPSTASGSVLDVQTHEAKETPLKTPLSFTEMRGSVRKSILDK